MGLEPPTRLAHFEKFFADGYFPVSPGAADLFTPTGAIVRFLENNSFFPGHFLLFVLRHAAICKVPGSVVFYNWSFIPNHEV